MSSHGSGINTFPPEIWIVILRNLRRPIPAPMSRPPRWELRQPWLPRAISVCKLFQRICTPLLYRHIVTDDLAGFLSHFRTQSGLKPLKLVESLYVEYQEPPAGVTYYMLMKHGRAKTWDAVAPSPQEEKAQIFRKCQAESEGIEQMLTAFTQRDTKKVLPRMRTVAVSSIYGSSGIWEDYERFQGTSGSETISACIELWDRFLITSNVENVCFRNGGPLSLEPVNPRVRPELNVPQLTLHLGNHLDVMGLRVGGRVRWISSGKDWNESYELLAGWISRLVQRRNSRYLKTKRDVIDLEIYCSSDTIQPLRRVDPRRSSIIPRLQTLAASISGGTSPRLTDDVQRAIASKIGDVCQSSVRQISNVKDTIRWRARSEVPVCEACGEGPPL